MQCARFSGADCTSDISTGGLVWPHFSTSAPRGYRPLQLEEKRGEYVNIFIIAHFDGTSTLSVIQANITRGNIRLGEFAFKLESLDDFTAW